MSNWYLGVKDYKQAIKSWEETFNSSRNLSKIDITEISKQIENIFQCHYFKKFSSTFVEDIIWIGSQARIFQDNIEVHKCVDTFLKEVTKILYNGDQFEIHLNTIIGITIPRIKKYIPNVLPSIKSCLTKNEIKLIKDQLDQYELSNILNEGAYDIDKSKQMQLIKRYIRSPSLMEFSSKVEILLDIATGDSEKAPIASASINYLLATDDVINDDLGILGLVDDMYAIELGIRNTNPKNLFNRLVNKHNSKYPSFDLPAIDSGSPLSLINLESLVKASYTKIDDDKPLKRLLIVPDTGPLHILSAMGKAICNRLDNSMTTSNDSIPFNQGDKILIGEIPAVSHGNAYMKKVFVEYDSPVIRAPNLFYVRTAGEGEKETIPKITLLDSSLCLDKEQKISTRNDLKKFKREDGKKIIPWGSIEFNKNIKTIPADSKIFIFCKKNNLELYLNEEVYGVPIKSWFGLRYFNKDFKFKDHISPYSLFPEPIFYSASNKEIAMEMIRGKWEEESIARQPDLIIIKEPSWLEDLEFLKLLRKCKHDIVIENDFFRKSNNLIKQYGFDELAAKPDALIPIKESRNSINQSLIERFLMKSQPFKIIPKIIDSSVLDEIYTLMRKTNFTSNDFIFKCQLQNLLKKIRMRIIPHTMESSLNLSIEFTKITEELTFLSKVNPEYLKLSKLILGHTRDLLEFDRSKAIEDCIAKIKPSEKTKIVINRAQLKEARKIFNNGSRNLDFILPAELESQKELKNLIIPFFLGTEYSTKLRNFKYADNHIFLLSESEEIVHKLMEKRDKDLFTNLYSDNTESRNKPSFVSQNDVEIAVNQIDPSTNIFQHSISIVNSQFQSSNRDENIDCRIFSLENDQTIILPVGGSTLISDPDSFSHSPILSKVSTFEIGDKLIIPKSFSGHDLLEAVLRSDAAKYAEYIKINKRACAWQEILKEYKTNNNLDSCGLHKALKKVGIKRNIATIRSWINDPDTVAPRNRDDIIGKIYSLEHTSNISKEACLKSIKIIYNAREDARSALVANLKGKVIKNDQSSFRVAINEMDIDFQILKIESVADVNVQFKYLYHLRSYEELNYAET
jgi:hypothetical protein